MATQYSDNIVKAEPQAVGTATPFVIRKIGLSDLSDALRLGWEDFKAVPSHAIILCVIYPVLGLVLFRMVLGYSVLPLLFPLAAGFTLIGPSPRSVSMNSAAAVSAARKPLRGTPSTCCAHRLSAPCSNSACSCSFCSGLGSPPRTRSTSRPSAMLRLQASLISRRVY